jgi:hypothetical protein
VVAQQHRLPEMLFPLGRSVCVLAISAWADESESAENQFLCLSAYISSANRWRKFQREWIRHVHPLPFHMVDFRKPQSTLRLAIGDDRKVASLALRVGKIIREHTIQGFSLTINPIQYEHLTSHRFRSQYGSAYAFAGMVLWETIRIWVEDNRYRNKINFWLEEGHVHAEEFMQKIWAHKRKSPIQSLIGDFGFGSKLDHPQLQAADTLAYSTYETILRLKRAPVIELGKIKVLHCSEAFIKQRIADVKTYRDLEYSERRAMNAVERDARLAIKLQLSESKDIGGSA